MSPLVPVLGLLLGLASPSARVQDWVSLVVVQGRGEARRWVTRSGLLGLLG